MLHFVKLKLNNLLLWFECHFRDQLPVSFFPLLRNVGLYLKWFHLKWAFSMLADLSWQGCPLFLGAYGPGDFVFLWPSEDGGVWVACVPIQAGGWHLASKAQKQSTEACSSACSTYLTSTMGCQKGSSSITWHPPSRHLLFHLQFPLFATISATSYPCLQFWRPKPMDSLLPFLFLSYSTSA